MYKKLVLISKSAVLGLVESFEVNLQNKVVEKKVK